MISRLAPGQTAACQSQDRQLWADLLLRWRIYKRYTCPSPRRGFTPLQFSPVCVSLNRTTASLVCFSVAANRIGPIFWPDFPNPFKLIRKFGEGSPESSRTFFSFLFFSWAQTLHSRNVYFRPNAFFKWILGGCLVYFSPTFWNTYVFFHYD